MKLVVAGSRKVRHPTKVTQKRDITFEEVAQVCEILDRLHKHMPITEVVSGGAAGADAIGEYWANMRQIPIKLFKADWKRHGKSAGLKRNQKMADYGDKLFLIWDTYSTGAKHMRDCMIKAEKGVIYHYLGWDNELERYESRAAKQVDKAIAAAHGQSASRKKPKV